MDTEASLPLVTLYSKADCHLCDIMKERLEKIRKRIPFNLETIDITAIPELFETYKNRIPVILINGWEANAHNLSEKGFVRKLKEYSSRTSFWSRLRRKPT